MNYKLTCLSWNPRHVRFRVSDRHAASVGELCVLTDDVFHFIQNAWKADLDWNGQLPNKAVQNPEAYGAIPR